MKLLLDMNLSPAWVPVLEAAGHVVVHWGDIGSSGAPDTEIFLACRARGAVLLTADLDFGAVLAASGATAPSVVQLRLDDLLPGSAGGLVCSVLTQFAADLASGALISVDAERARARVLPLR